MNQDIENPVHLTNDADDNGNDGINLNDIGRIGNSGPISGRKNSGRRTGIAINTIIIIIIIIIISVITITTNTTTTNTTTISTTTTTYNNNNNNDNDVKLLRCELWSSWF